VWLGNLLRLHSISLPILCCSSPHLSWGFYFIPNPIILLSSICQMHIYHLSFSSSAIFFQIFNFIFFKCHCFLPYQTVLINSLTSKINVILCHIYWNPSNLICFLVHCSRSFVVWCGGWNPRCRSTYEWRHDGAPDCWIGCNCRRKRTTVFVS
jgi:hypothetical protein